MTYCQKNDTEKALGGGDLARVISFLPSEIM